MKYFMGVKKVRNLTPHDVVIIRDDGTKLVYEPEPVPARVSVKLEDVESQSDFPMFLEVYGDVVGLPKAEYGTVLIVSGLVCSARPDRLDLVHPAGLVRDDNGNVVGCKGLCSPYGTFS